MTDIHTCSHRCTRPACVIRQRDDLVKQIDEQGGQLVAWRDRAIAAEAELARLRAVEPVSWKHDCAGLCTNGVELWIDACPHCGKPRAAPPAQPAHADEFRCPLCLDDPANIAQPAEPVQLTEELEAIVACLGDDAAMLRDKNPECEIAANMEAAARAIESAIHPQWLSIDSAPKDEYIMLWCPTHIQKGVQAMPFTGRYMSNVPWIIVNADMAIQKVHPTHWMPLPAAPKGTT